MTAVYIVLSESGEYSDRMVWIGGVYDTLAAAQSAVAAAAHRRAVYDEWQQRYSAELGRAQITAARSNLWTVTLDSRAAEVRASRMEPQPPYEAGQRFSIYPANVGEWRETE
jgi:hypothetical protein